LNLIIGSSYTILDEPTASLDSHLWLESGEFTSIVKMARDPVCGMSMDQKRAPAKATY
jgi:ABC-type multidrug transport system ATPase subunit